MKITNKSKNSVEICKPGDSSVCIEVEPKQVVEFPDDKAKEILEANSSLEEVKEKGKKAKE